MSETLLVFLASLAVMLLGARLFLSSSIVLSRLLRFSEIIVGATIISMATTMPESLVSLFASATNHSGLALGTVVGSGLINLGLLFGLILLSGKEPREKGGDKRRSLLLLGLVFFVYLWSLLFGKINFWGGLALIGLAFFYLAYTFHYALKEAGESLLVVEEKLESHLSVLGKFFVGSLLLIVGARFLVQNAVSLATVFGLPEVIVGLTLVALGTSFPELVTALTALFSGHAKLSLGNLVGATVLTFTFALGLAALFSEVPVPNSLLRFEFPLLLFFSLLSVLYGLFPRIPQRLLGFFLVAGFVLYLVSLF